ncbi:Pirin-like protein [Seminavis robusta]|uniref:Pirin-like protein n=1 Tax=Seminavis robusta TaxID=568900 RepID=A0A9N8DAR1_9STRA|nr:Pirin-like protein [Seminavis robusta]|eukprot:Sro56_g032800.1 Pirin-like protein (368) ;mRNA; r:73384-74857
MKAASAVLNTMALPSAGPFRTLDPFLFCVYHKDAYPPAHDETMEAPQPGNGMDFNPSAPYRMYHGDMVPGFPSHPHRGFETITATIDGLIDHSDSLGNGGRYGEGDLQWMTAGKGIVHAEMFPLIFKEKPNPTRFFQIWINLPARSKMVEPSFAMFWNNDVPKWKSPDEKAAVTVFYGDYFLEASSEEEENKRVMNPNQPPQDSWATDHDNDVAILHVTIQPGGTIEIPKAHESDSKTVNRVLYCIEGLKEQPVINEVPINDGMITVDASSALDISLSSSASQACELLLLQGKPIDEPVAQHGPFVMNSRSEIEQAFMDYSKTKFGGWPWPRDDMVFPREKGRFALLYGEETTPADADTGVCEEPKS